MKVRKIVECLEETKKDLSKLPCTSRILLKIKGLQSAIDFFEEWLLDNDDEEDEG